jgi:hypothetical protein
MLEAWRPVARLATVIVMAGFLFACSGDKPAPRDDLAAACSAVGGTWLSQYHECETDDRTWCEVRDGKFEFCASPCRHSPGQICATVCQPVCSLSQ